MAELSLVGITAQNKHSSQVCPLGPQPHLFLELVLFSFQRMIKNAMNSWVRLE